MKIGHGDIVLSGDLLFKKRFISSVNQSCLHLWVCITLNGCTSSPLPANTPSSSSRTSFTTPSPLDAILNKINELTPTRINTPTHRKIEHFYKPCLACLVLVCLCGIPLSPSFQKDCPHLNYGRGCLQEVRGINICAD